MLAVRAPKCGGAMDIGGAIFAYFSSCTVLIEYPSKKKHASGSAGLALGRGDDHRSPRHHLRLGSGARGHRRLPGACHRKRNRWAEPLAGRAVRVSLRGRSRSRGNGPFVPVVSDVLVGNGFSWRQSKGPVV